MLADLRQSYENDGTPRDSIAAVMRRFGQRGSPLPFAWQTMLPDPTGRLWLQVAECGRAAVRQWEVIDTAGRGLASFRLASDSGLRGVRGDRAAVFSADSLDVIYVNVFRLR
jgi:hypothetical protein